MVGLTDAQLEIITTAVNAVPAERRSIFLERVGAMLKVRGRFSDADVSDVAKLAMAGLIQHTADVARRTAPRKSPSTIHDPRITALVVDHKNLASIHKTS